MIRARLGAQGRTGKIDQRGAWGAVLLARAGLGAQGLTGKIAQRGAWRKIASLGDFPWILPILPGYRIWVLNFFNNFPIKLMHIHYNKGAHQR